jgi:hypothetical protein
MPNGKETLQTAQVPTAGIWDELIESSRSPAISSRSSTLMLFCRLLHEYCPITAWTVFGGRLWKQEHTIIQRGETFAGPLAAGRIVQSGTRISIYPMPLARYTPPPPPPPD